MVSILRYNPAMHVLLVKLSSLGDVLHNLPVVSDLVLAFPDIEIDWVTEAPYAQLVGLHPGVKRVFPMHLRALKSQWWSPLAWSAMSEDKARLRGHSYDIVLDTQGLVKSALVARAARAPGTSVAGFSPETAREPLAARFYDRHFSVPRDLHAVERNRRLAAGIFGYPLPHKVDYGLRLPAKSHDTPATPLTPRARTMPYVVFLHATSRADKMWPELHWVALGRRLADAGFGVVLPWGNDLEQRTSERLASSIPGAIVPAAMTLVEAAGLLNEARGVVGVDTGLAHLAVALARPTVGLYLTTSPALTGLLGNDCAANLGGGNPQQAVTPSVDAAWNAIHALLDGA
jgi:heptosyltransferase-1